MTHAAAHGKVILLGEHACVYGTPALAAALDRGARAEASLADGSSRLSLGGTDVDASQATQADVARAFEALLAAAPCPALHVAAVSELLPGGGLGSSAALGVAIGRAVAELARGHADEGEAIARATAWEQVFHGNPSGIDVAVAAGGGCLCFTRSHGAEPIAPGRDLWFAIGSTGAGASTRVMVEGVADLRKKKPEIVDRAVEAIRVLVGNATLAVQAGDMAALGKLMDLNQMVLAGLFLSTEAIEALCASARAAGALGAKLTGAGGGGSVVALIDTRAAAAGAKDEHAEAQAAGARVLEAWRAEGYDGFLTRVGASTPLPRELA